jgi:GMP synthase-like glutamine amidotransferase
MTVLYVDMEHDRVVHDPVSGPAHRARRERAQARVAAAAGEPCAVLGYGAISAHRLQHVAPRAVVLSGNTTDWNQFAWDDLEGLLAVIRTAPVPILGICAGHQLIGHAHGATWGPLGPLQEGETDPDPRFAPGQRKERDFLPVQVDPRCPLFYGLGSTAHFFQSHYWQLHDVPAEFIVRACSPWSPIQAIEHLDRPLFGVLFHPERYDAAHPDGEVVLRNFFALAGDR